MSLVQNHKNPTKNNKSIPCKDSMATGIINPTFLRRLKFNKSPNITARQSNTLAIDPWYVNEDNIKQRFEFVENGNQNLVNQAKAQKKFAKQQNNNSQQVNKSKTNRFQNIDKQDNFSPLKFDKLEQSFHFYEDEHEKFHKIQNEYITQAQIDHNQGSTMDRNMKNFIKKNIRNAFYIQHQITQQNRNLTTRINKNKTIFNEAKQRLLLNNQKLKQSSKQLTRFISMKDSIPTKPYNSPYDNDQTHHSPFKIPIDSVWNFSYVEKQLNPEHYSHNSINRFKKMLVKCSKGKQKTSSFTKTSQSFNTPFQQINVAKSQNQFSRKLSRLHQAKKKLALVIEGDRQKNSMENKYTGEKINKDSHYRIHSLTRNNKGNNQHVELNSQLNNDNEGQQRLGFQWNQSSRNKQKIMPSQQISRSFSAKILNKTVHKQK